MCQVRRHYIPALFRYIQERHDNDKDNDRLIIAGNFSISSIRIAIGSEMKGSYAYTEKQPQKTKEG
jgi:hypothetical protein